VSLLLNPNPKVNDAVVRAISLPLPRPNPREHSLQAWLFSRIQGRLDSVHPHIIGIELDLKQAWEAPSCKAVNTYFFTRPQPYLDSQCAWIASVERASNQSLSESGVSAYAPDQQ
jgi:hypothetical protein